MTKLKYDVAYIESLANIIKNNNLSELVLEDGESCISLRREKEVVVQQSSAPALSVATALPPVPTSLVTANSAGKASDAEDDGGHIVKSPMVGTVYLQSEPGKPPFIKVGDKVSKGQTLLIIEAMKVMNPIASPVDGVIKDIKIKDSDPVEFDQPLVVIG